MRFPNRFFKPGFLWLLVILLSWTTDILAAPQATANRQSHVRSAGGFNSPHQEAAGGRALGTQLPAADIQQRGVSPSQQPISMNSHGVTQAREAATFQDRPNEPGEDGPIAMSEATTDARTTSGLAPEPIELLPPQGTKRGRSADSNLMGKPPWVTTFGSLAVVLAAFFVLAWFIKRTRPKGMTALPLEAVELLGRRPLDGKQHLQVVRFGNKILLVAVTANSAQTLCELDDVDEVNHVLELCHKGQSGGVTDSFRQVLSQMGKERASGFLEDESTRQATAGNSTSSRPRRSRALFEA
jgi:flagellar biogenesis protein FliO